jgi:hypothetical protein
MLLGLYEISYSKNKGFPVVRSQKVVQQNRTTLRAKKSTYIAADA